MVSGLVSELASTEHEGNMVSMFRMQPSNQRVQSRSTYQVFESKGDLERPTGFHAVSTSADVGIAAHVRKRRRRSMVELDMRSRFIQQADL